MMGIGKQKLYDGGIGLAILAVLTWWGVCTTDGYDAGIPHNWKRYLRVDCIGESMEESRHEGMRPLTGVTTVW
jgi:hypothetical protein